MFTCGGPCYLSSFNSLMGTVCFIIALTWFVLRPSGSLTSFPTADVWNVKHIWKHLETARCAAGQPGS